jgi:hypothetical protein
LAPVGVPQTEETLLPALALRRSPIYNDFLQRVDAPHLLTAWLHRTPDRAVALSIQGTRQRGTFTATERDRFAAVLPRITRAIELKDRLALGTGVLTSLIAIADTLPMGGSSSTSQHINSRLARTTGGFRRPKWLIEREFVH